MCTGPPWTGPYLDVIWVARIACSGVIGRIETTNGPEKRPAGVQSTLVRYIGTFTPCSTWRIGRPSARSARSNVNEQPIRNATRSSRQTSRASSGSSTSWLVHQLAVAEHPVAREVAAQVRACRPLGGLGRAGIGDVE